MNARREEAGAPVVRPEGKSVHLTGLLIRILGIFLWGKATPESLPVPPLEASPGASASPIPAAVRRLGRINRALAGAAVLGGVLAAALTLFAVLHLQETVGGFPVSGDSLLDSGQRLRSGWTGGAWTRLYPSFGERLRRAAGIVEAGREALVEADRARVACSISLNSMELPGRMMRGAGLVGPFEAAMARITSPFHRGTAAYQVMQEQLLPYQQLRSKPPEAIRASLTKSEPGHALALLLRDRSGKVLWPSSPPFVLNPGETVELPLVEGAVVRLSDVARAPGGAYGVVEDMDLPLEKFSGRGLAFPHGGTFFRLRFDPADSTLAPAFPPLPLAAEEELLPLPPELRGR